MRSSWSAWLSLRVGSMPTLDETVASAVEIFSSSSFPGGQASPASAWAGFYQALLWYEQVTTVPGHSGLPHIIDANRLTRQLTTQGKLSAWQQHAVAVESYLAHEWGVQPD